MSKMNFFEATIISILLLAPNVSVVKCAVMEATIQIESDNIQMTSFLDRFKNFIALSHDQQGNSDENGTTIDNFVQHNDSFQANYDFSKNLLTIGSSYSLLINGTEKKISDVKIIINFKFTQNSNERIVLEDIYGNAVPKIGVQPRSSSFKEEIVKENYEDIAASSYFASPAQLLSFVVDITEPVILTLLGIVVNGVLGHVLTTAFDHFYQGRVTI